MLVVLGKKKTTRSEFGGGTVQQKENSKKEGARKFQNQSDADRFQRGDIL